MLSVLYLQWLPGWSEFSLNFTLTRCVHFSIEMIRPLFRVKWRLFPKQHSICLSYLFPLKPWWFCSLCQILGIGYCTSSVQIGSLNLSVACWILFLTSPLGSTNQKTCSKGCAQLHCFSCRWPKTPTWLNACLRSIPLPLVFLKTPWILNCWIHLKIVRKGCVNWLAGNLVLTTGLKT